MKSLPKALLPFLFTFLLAYPLVSAVSDQLILVDVSFTQDARFYLYNHSEGEGSDLFTLNLSKVGEAKIEQGALFVGSESVDKNATTNRTFIIKTIVPGAGGYMTGDVDGDGKDELIQVDVITSDDAHFYIWKYDGSLGDTGRTVNLSLMGEAEIEQGALFVPSVESLRNETSRGEIAIDLEKSSPFLMGDVDGDGIDEFLLVDILTSNHARFFSYQYEVGGGKLEGPGFANENLTRELEGEVRYASWLDWKTGDIDGDGKDELIGIDKSTSNDALLRIYRFEPTVETGAIIPPLPKSGEVRISQGAYLDWEMADVDGDGVDEIVGIDLAITSNAIRLYYYQFAPGVGPYSAHENATRAGGAYFFPGAQYLVAFGNLLEEPQAEPSLELPIEGRPGGIFNRPPTIRLLSPRGGEKWSRTQEVLWEASDPEGGALLIDLEIRREGGAAWSDLLRGAGNSGSYRWDTSTVPDGMYLLRARARDPRGAEAVSVTAEAFRIDNTVPSIELLLPRDRVRWKGTVRISWKASDAGGGPLLIHLLYSPDLGENWYLLTRSEAWEGEFLWDTSGFPNGQKVLLRATVTDQVNEASATSGVLHLDQREYRPILISTDPPGATVYIDGVEVGVSGREIEVPVGRHQIVLRKIGYQEWEGVVEVGPDVNPPLEVELSPKILGFSPPELFALLKAAVLGLVALGIALKAFFFVTGRIL
jgi:hypothetical protein